jgi:hypothetical protein
VPGSCVVAQPPSVGYSGDRAATFLLGTATRGSESPEPNFGCCAGIIPNRSPPHTHRTGRTIPTHVASKPITRQHLLADLRCFHSLSLLRLARPALTVGGCVCQNTAAYLLVTRRRVSAVRVTAS